MPGTILVGSGGCYGRNFTTAELRFGMFGHHILCKKDIDLAIYM